jgi:hypothetical protein
MTIGEMMMRMMKTEREGAEAWVEKHLGLHSGLRYVTSSFDSIKISYADRTCIWFENLYRLTVLGLEPLCHLQMLYQPKLTCLSRS